MGEQILTSVVMTCGQMFDGMMGGHFFAQLVSILGVPGVVGLVALGLLDG